MEFDLQYLLYSKAMRSSDRNPLLKRPYANISLKKREQLVKYVLEDALSISKAAKRIKIKLTTARLIIKKYKETGTFPMKKFKETPIPSFEIPSHADALPQESIEANICSEEPAFSPHKQCEEPCPEGVMEGAAFTGGVYFYYLWPYGYGMSYS